ncbi:MAG: MmcQ/YjbR family DNA-binding protein [Chitinophagaceae bacterium]|nr:MmcQ/YjbR family DNA-binding protein [Chitinophagaceae bacterium]
MTLEGIEEICTRMPHVTADIKWETHVCYCVGGKIFIITNPENLPVTASFKVDDDDFGSLSEKEGCKPAPYLAKYKWIYIDDINRMSKKEWEKYLKKAHQIVAAKLPPKIKKQLGIG